MSGFTQNLILNYLQGRGVATLGEIHAAVASEYAVDRRAIRSALYRMAKIGLITRQQIGIYALRSGAAEHMHVAGILDDLEERLGDVLEVELVRRGWVRSTPRTARHVANLLKITPDRAMTTLCQLRRVAS